MRRTALDAAAATVVAALVAALGLYAMSLVQWPAYTGSNVTRALTTVGQVAAAAVIGVSVWLMRAGRAPVIAKLASWVGVSALVTVTLGMPLAATKLYLFGVSVDQEFRTAYLTRLTDSAALHDMTYTGIAPYYPAGWFWLGGRLANVFGLAGWEAFKPWAIASLAVAAALALVLWTQLVRRDTAVLAATGVSVLALAYASPESYGAVVAVLIPPVLLLAWGALARTGSGGWAATLGVGLFLGVAATFYTLYFGYAAATVTVMAVVVALGAVRRTRSWRGVLTPAAKLATMAVVAAVIASTVWAPYVLAALRGTPAAAGTALHYLPGSGSELPLPMLQASLLGVACMIGTIWIIVRVRASRRAQALGLGAATVYLWALASMAATAAGTTLLGFRLEPVLIGILGAAGVFGSVEGARAIYLATNESGRVRTVLVSLAVIGTLGFTQRIPIVLGAEITVAYTDTDGNGQRADKRDPNAASYFADVDRALQDATGKPARESVVLTADTTFLAFYPYYGFQGPTSHYANPLAEYAARADTIERWSKAATSDELISALDSSPWRAPDAFLFRRATADDGSATYTLRLAQDVYPNDPNVRRYTVAFDAAVFDDPQFRVQDIGPFTLITRVRA